MINHARTLLLNVAGPHAENLGIPGDVYIPEYAAVVLPPDLQMIWNTLFGDAPDYDGLVHHVAQYMAILHSTEYGAYVTDLDPRLTYDPKNSGIMAEGFFGVSAGGPTAINIEGNWDGAGAGGRVVTEWDIVALDADTLEVTNRTDRLSAIHDKLGVKTLPGSTLYFSMDAQPYVSGTRWRVCSKARPKPYPSDVISLLKPDVITTLFLDRNSEPVKTFYNLYAKHWALPQRLSGVLLGLIHAIEELKNGSAST